VFGDKGGTNCGKDKEGSTLSNLAEFEARGESVKVIPIQTDLKIEKNL
jgi:hypothetical protein